MNIIFGMILCGLAGGVAFHSGGWWGLVAVLIGQIGIGILNSETD